MKKIKEFFTFLIGFGVLVVIGFISLIMVYVSDIFEISLSKMFEFSIAILSVILISYVLGYIVLKRSFDSR